MQKMQLVKYKAGKYTFEVGCKPGAVLKYRQELAPYESVLESDVVRTILRERSLAFSS